MASVRRLEIRIDQTGSAIKGIGLLTSALGGLGSVAVTAAGVGIGIAAAAVIKLGAESARVAGDFEEQMNILSVAARNSGTSFEELSEAAIAVGADTSLVGISASQAADAMTNFYKAGLSTGEIISDLDGYLSGSTELTGALRAAVDLAAASELDLGAASDTVAIAMATFGLSAKDASRIADSFVASADASVADVSDLADALINVGPTAATFGWSLEQVNTALALLSERGIRGAEAGTALKSMMTNMMRDTNKVKGVWDELGISLYDAGGHMKSLPLIMSEVETAMVGMTEEQKNQTVQTLAGTYGMKAMQTLLAEGSLGWQGMTASIAAGASAQETAAARTRGFNAALEQMHGSIEALLIRVGTPLINEFLTPAIQLFTEWLSELEAVGRQALPVMYDALTRIVNAFNYSNKEISLSDALLKGLDTTLDVVITAIQLMAATLHALSIAVEAVGKAVKYVIDRWNEMKRAAQSAVNAIPSWLRPGSPTPFEMGLRGIGNALNDLDFGALNVSTPTPAMAGGGGPVNVYLTYSPAVSLGDRYEAETKLVPYIQRALQQARAM